MDKKFKLPVFRTVPENLSHRIAGVPDFSLDRHKEVRVLGQGSFGTVRLYDDPSGEKVAVKSFMPPLNHAAIRKEVRLLSTMQHENIVRVVGFNGMNGALLAMEYCVFDFSVFGGDQAVSSLSELLRLLDATLFMVRTNSYYEFLNSKHISR